MWDVASGIDRHPDRTEIHFRLQIQGIESTSLVSVLFREVFSHHYISFTKSSKNVLCY